MDDFSIDDFKTKLVHFVGIGGISMSALAQILKKNGVSVQGSDLSKNEETEKLERAGIKVFYDHKKENLKGVSVVVYSSAIHDDNEEIAFAKNKKLIIFKRAELLGIISKSYKNVIAIAGSHGKTTTASMISEIFLKAKRNPTIHVGGVLTKLKSNYRLGGTKYFITEACEYMDNYLYLSPKVSVVLNIDGDHLDYFKNIDGVKESFCKFVSKTQVDGLTIISNDDENSKSLNAQNIATFGLNKRSDIYAKNIREYLPCKFSFDVVFLGENLGNIKLSIFGKHNISNALSSVFVALLFDIDFKVIKSALENFSGTERRTQIISTKNDILMIHDYAHHPKQIEKMIELARCLTKKHGKIIVVFEPHTYSRTKFLLEDFARSFVGADHVIFAPVYSARELISAGVESDVLAEETKKYLNFVEYIQTYNDIRKRIFELTSPNDVVLILGAGSINHLMN